MIAGPLYAIGLIASLVTIVMVGFSVPALYGEFMTATDVPGADYLAALSGIGRHIGWALGPFVGGLVMMGLGQVLFLLGAINRALRGAP